MSTTEELDTDAIIQETPARLAKLEVSEALRENLMGLSKATSSGIKGIEGVQTRFKVSEVRMRQPISNSSSIPADCKPGQLYSSSGDLFGDSMLFIPVLRHTQRKKWLEDNKLDCISLDGVTGSRYGNCKECPHSKYEKGKPVACSQGHSFYVVSPDLKNFYRIDFSKSSAKAGQNILKLTDPPSLWGKIFVLSTEHVAKAGRNYYSLATRASGQRPSPEVMAVCEVLYDYLHAQYVQTQERWKKSGAEEESEVVGVTDVIIDATDDGGIDFSKSM